jgi:hypothetical protein
MRNKYSGNTPVLEQLLEPGEGQLMNLIASFAVERRADPATERWPELEDYLNTATLSESAKKLGAYMLGTKSGDEVGPNIAAVGEWYIDATENEKQQSRILFRQEPAA